MQIAAPSSMDPERQTFLLLRSCAATASFPPLAIRAAATSYRMQPRTESIEGGLHERHGRGSGDGEGAASRRSWRRRRRRRHLGLDWCRRRLQKKEYAIVCGDFRWPAGLDLGLGPLMDKNCSLFCGAAAQKANEDAHRTYYGCIERPATSKHCGGS